jgi:preprotein translocase subunit SecE
VATMSKKHDATVDHEADEHDGYQASRTAQRPDTNRGLSEPKKKKRGMTTSTFWREMFTAGVYKRQQGRIARQVTFGAMLAVFGIGCWRMSQYLVSAGALLQIGIPLALFAVGVWVAYRLVNYPAFADFLIAVEAEMAKVSWPTKIELFRSSVVVILTIFGLAAILAIYDLVWHQLLVWLQVIR